MFDRGFIMRDEKGRAVRMLGSIADETEKLAIEARLNQAQKMEAVGQLTGGVAHDFNNLLTVILGSTDMLLNRLDEQPKLRQLAEMTSRAARRGAELTHRLLAFSRKQPLEPAIVNLNEAVRGMETMFVRTLGEHIDIAFILDASIGQVEIDPSQFENALLNLAINARDAMEGGGRLTIETQDTVLEEAYAAAHDEVMPGPHVMVSVSDDGDGMTPEVMERVFEPFSPQSTTAKEAASASR